MSWRTRPSGYNGTGQYDQTSKDHQRLTAHPFGYAIHIYLKILHLREKNHDCQAIHKSQHHRMRHDTDKFAQLQDTGEYLNQAGKHHCCEQKFHTMVSHQRYHHHCHSAGCTGYHARATAKDRCQ